MSTTALVRSPSSSTSLAAPVSRPQSTSPSNISKTYLPNLSPAHVTKSTPPSTSTPQLPPSPAPSTPGRWQHPRMDEIVRRQSRTNFDKTNVYAVLWNILFFFLSFGASSVLATTLPTPTLRALQPYPSYVLLLLRAFFLLNIALACAPLFRKSDSCEDIPLTPAQRQLLGLPPLSRPATPQEKERYITPPRYARSVTPSSSLRGETPGSNNRGAGTPFRSPSGSPLTPYGGARSGAGAERRRLSYTSTRSSPLSVSELDAAGGIGGGTPTKSNNRASVGLNNKWLYEKGKANASAWGSGSVFS